MHQLLETSYGLWSDASKHNRLQHLRTFASSLVEILKLRTSGNSYSYWCIDDQSQHWTEITALCSCLKCHIVSELTLDSTSLSMKVVFHHLNLTGRLRVLLHLLCVVRRSLCCSTSSVGELSLWSLAEELHNHPGRLRTSWTRSIVRFCVWVQWSLARMSFFKIYQLFPSIINRCTSINELVYW